MRSYMCMHVHSITYHPDYIGANVISRADEQVPFACRDTGTKVSKVSAKIMENGNISNKSL